MRVLRWRRGVRKLLPFCHKVMAVLESLIRRQGFHSRLLGARSVVPHRQQRLQLARLLSHLATTQELRLRVRLPRLRHSPTSPRHRPQAHTHKLTPPPTLSSPLPSTTPSPTPPLLSSPMTKKTTTTPTQPSPAFPAPPTAGAPQPPTPGPRQRLCAKRPRISL